MDAVFALSCSIEARLNALERENRSLRSWMRRVPLLVLALAGVGALTGAAFQARAESALEVIDAAGRIRGVLYADEGKNNSGLEIRDRASKPRLRIRTDTKLGDAILEFIDANGNVRLAFGVDDNGETIFVRDGKAR